jgi:hypothetical protein
MRGGTERVLKGPAQLLRGELGVRRVVSGDRTSLPEVRAAVGRVKVRIALFVGWPIWVVC